MKYTMLVIILALAVATAAFAQDTTRNNAVRAKQQFQTKQHVLRAKKMFLQKRQILRSGIIDMQQAAKARYMMKRMALQRRQNGAAIYPKGETLYRLGQRGERAAWQADGIRGKQAFAGKQMLQNCPYREKIEQHMQGR